MSEAGPFALLGPAYRGRALLLLVLIIAAALSEGAGLALLVPLLATLMQGPGGRIAELVADLGLPLAPGPLLALFVALASLRAGLNFWRGQVSTHLEFDLVDALRGRAWRALLHCDWRMLMNLERADTTSALIYRIDQSGFYVNQVIGATATALTLGGVGLAALAISWRMALAAALGGGMVVLAYRGLRQRAERTGDRMGQDYSRIYGRLNEGLGALRMIKSLGGEEAASSGLAREFSALRSSRLTFQRDQGLARATLQIGGAIFAAVLAWTTLVVWRLPVATVLPMVALFARAIPLLEVLQGALLGVAHTRPAVRSTLALIAAAEAAREPDLPLVQPPVPAREITLAGVTVRSGDSILLDDASGAIEARAITAIVGPSGAGKSTLADLIGGLITPDEGQVLIDGSALEEPLLRAWRRRVAYVHQDPVVLSASVRDNLRWAAPGTGDAGIVRALRDAAADFALGLPQGLDTMLGDGGRQLSGGERQRLMLARALLRDPALLILDEATSALDAESEAQIAAVLERLKARMAIVVISHRGALLDIADRTIRLDRGQIVSR
ncbi:MAG: ABC transporter ATP-binding protein [Sphingomonadales bacterium]|nr:ABC transporter ATP-binding protein [Sphingomonadales bacterium]